MFPRMGLKPLFSTLGLPGVCMAYSRSRTDQLPGYLDVESKPLGQERPVIVSISAKSPAARSGLNCGDAICEIDGKAIDGPDALLENIRRRRPGSLVPIVVLRNAVRVALRVRIGYRPEESIDLKAGAVGRLSL